ncbi:MAG TPA: MlaD family protein [Thermoleophilaceae bacterium]|nr:MlaD family protein [Thermoleophilaceae bacterium]
MTRGRGTASIVASPVLVGAVTVLVAIVAVFLAYNANQGLPFVPTYDIRAEVPSGAKLVAGNEVRAGGFRVGVVEDITPEAVEINGEQRAIAVIDMKLDQTIEPLSADTAVRVRPRSALGLKYVELTPTEGGEDLAPGDTLALSNASEPLDLEDVLSTFDPPTRRSVQTATVGFGDAFAGRGASLNVAIEALNPLFRNLVPVMSNLAAEGTELDQFFVELGESAAQVAPVAEVQAGLFAKMADTFAAFAESPVSLQQTIERSPPTLAASIDSFRKTRPFLSDFADLAGRLRPAAQELPRSLPPLNTALAVGTPVLPRTVELSDRLGDSFGALGDLMEEPSTLLALRDLREGVAVTRPAIEYIAPFQTVCNFTVYFIHSLGELQSPVQAGPTGAGTVLNQNIKLVNFEQPNTLGSITSSRPWDVPPDQDPRTASDAGGALGRVYSPPYSPAIDAQGNADCQVGQVGYMRGPFSTGARYGSGVLSDDTPTGGNWAVTDNDFPGLRGGTYKSRELGIENLADVP